MMEAIILAGGFGTRLRHIVPDIPKPMAPVAGRPFLEYILDDLDVNGITKVTLAVGYKHASIIEHFQKKPIRMGISFSVETQPLLTGGAIKKALQECNGAEVLIVNGDTFFDVDLASMQRFHQEHDADITVATKEMCKFDRYGTLQCQDERIVSFVEKKATERGLINGGVYLLNRSVLDGVGAECFSFEKDFMEVHLKTLRMFAFESKGYFIDIGVPEDYSRAQTDFKDGTSNE